MPVVLMYPEIREAPNSDGTRFQSEPSIGGAKVLGCPAFPQQAEAALFTVLLYKLLGYDEPAYAFRVFQDMQDNPRFPGMAARRKIVEDSVLAFARSQKIEARAVPTPAPMEPAPMEPAPMEPAPPATTATEGQQQKAAAGSGSGKRGR